MLTIYSIPVSLYCAKLRILLRHKQLHWQEIEPLGGYGSDEYKKIVPSGNLPALVDDGLLIADSEAIAEYLNEKHPDPPMLPDRLEARAKTREFSRFHDTRLEPEVRKLFPHIDPGNRDAEIAEKQSRAINGRLAQLGRMIGERAENSHLTLGDCGYPITITWIELLEPVFGLEIEMPKKVSDYLHRISAFPAVATETNAYRARLETWLAAELGP